MNACITNDAFYYLIKEIELSTVNMSELPYCRDGILLYGSARFLFEIYVKRHQITDIESDIIIANFLNLTAGYYLYRESIPIPMAYAVQCGLITSPLSTIQIMGHCSTKQLGQILNLNLYTYDRVCEDPHLEDIVHPTGQTLSTLALQLTDVAVRAQLLREYEILKSIYYHENRKSHSQ